MRSRNACASWPAAGRAAGGRRRDDARRGARHPARERAQLLRCRRAAADCELGQHAVSGAGDDGDGAVARSLPGRCDLRDGALPERGGRRAHRRAAGRALRAALSP